MTTESSPQPGRIDQPEAPPAWFWRALVLLAVSFFLYSNWLTWTQLASNRVFLHDVGVFDVLLAGPRHGHFLRSPTEWFVGANYFAAHFRPILLVLMPFYYLHDGPMTYLTLQNAALFLAAIPLGSLAWRVTGSPVLALGLAFLYLANHFTGGIHFANHPEAFAPLFWFLLFDAVQRRHILLAAVGVLGVLSVKEDMGFYLVGYALALVLVDPRRNIRWAVVLGATGIVAFLGTGMIMKSLGQEVFHASGNNPLSRHASLGDSTGGIALHLLMNPLEAIQRVFRPSLLLLFASTGFLALRDWRTAWLVVWSAGFFLVADHWILSDLQYYYSYSALPFLFLATVRGVALLRRDLSPSLRPHLALPVVVLLLATVQLFLPTRTDNLRRVPFEVTDRHRFVREVIQLIPPDAPVAVQYNLFNRVPNRPVKLPIREWSLDHVDYILMDLHGPDPYLTPGEHGEEAARILERLRTDEFEFHFGNPATPDRSEGYLLLRRPNTR